MPVLGILYAISGIDRVNLSSARVSGMDNDLGFDKGNRYTIALIVFFVAYMVCEVPTTLMLRRIGPRILLTVLPLCYGASVLATGFAGDWRVVVVCRTLIGVFEGGLLPCCIVLLSSWYQRHEVMKRYGHH